jgi:hypothetical protein
VCVRKKKKLLTFREQAKFRVRFLLSTREDQGVWEVKFGGVFEMKRLIGVQVRLAMIKQGRASPLLMKVLVLMGSLGRRKFGVEVFRRTLMVGVTRRLGRPFKGTFRGVVRGQAIGLVLGQQTRDLGGMEVGGMGGSSSGSSSRSIVRVVGALRV